MFIETFDDIFIVNDSLTLGFIVKESVEMGAKVSIPLKTNVVITSAFLVQQEKARKASASIFRAQ